LTSRRRPEADGRERLLSDTLSTRIRKDFRPMPAQLPPMDHHGRSIEAGNAVRIRSVASCASGLPGDDQARLTALVGRLRPVSEVDVYGFVWISFDEGTRRSDFCLKATEVEVV
jgi:hypothetical protein